MRKSLMTAVAGLGCMLLAAGCASGAPAAVPKPHPVSPTQQTTAASKTRPNFVFVLTDDLSWNLVSHMPHVVGMEKHGIRLSRYYVVDSLCCPSRSAIFTGEYPHDDGVFTNVGNDGGYGAYVKNGDESRSFAVALQKSGYSTAMMGKYLNGYQPRTDPPAPGWDQWDVAGNGYPEFDYDLNENGKLVHYGSKPQDYLTSVLSQKASSFISTSASSGKPFMLEVATFAPHRP
jgi:N-acetylglucosamine-6-sulfatase